MEFQETVNNQLSWIVALAPLIITSTVVMLSTVMFIFSKRKPKLVEIHKSVQESSSNQIIVEDSLASKQQNESQANAQQKQASEGTGSYDQIDHDYLVRSSPDQLSNSEDSEVDRSPDCSDDGSISDEDSLIEISLPGGQHVSHKEDEYSKYCMQQRGLIMELLAVFNGMNEEDNLIEIDISMGSIKCSRIEIEA
ncbi:hypothetical protein PTKIN_Ptkin15bG0154200 [Pterospermum kingtungense]